MLRNLCYDVRGLKQLNMSGSEFQSNFHVCIIGGGVVGLTGGILLRRQGFQVTILERDPTLQTVSKPSQNSLALR